MVAFFIYSLKVGACLAWFYLFHKLLLSRDTLHTLNRWLLLAVMVLSLVLPLVHVTLAEPSPISHGTIAVEGFIVQAVSPAEGDTSMTLAAWLFLIYIIGVAFFLVRGALSIVGLFRLIRRATKIDESDGIKTYMLPGDVSPFSWFRYIVIGENDWRNGCREILLHERAHIARHHSADVLLCNLLITFQWYNPAAWLIKCELQAVHEFEADEAVLNAGVDMRQYQLLLIRKAVGEQMFAMANNLNHNSLKKRIKMMKIQKTHRLAALKAAAILPLAAIAITAFATNEAKNIERQVATESQALVNRVETSVLPTVAAETTPVANKETPATTEELIVKEIAAETLSPKDTTIYDVVDEMPKFETNINMWLAQNVVYPQEAIEKNIQGRVIVKFVIDAEGNVTNPEIVHSVHPSLDAEALRVVKAMPAWTPGKLKGKAISVRGAIPVTFNMIGGDEPTTVKADHQTIYVVDGKKTPEDAFTSMKPEAVKDISVAKDAETVAKYGGKEGDTIILVSTKK